MISVFAKHKSPRLEYLLDFCFGAGGEEWQIITLPQKWRDISVNRINYSEDLVEAEVTIRPHAMVYQGNVDKDVSITVVEDRLLIDGMDDPFAVMFFILSRMEEYGDEDRDEHDRYKSKNHTLVKLGLHKRPIVDEIVLDLWKMLGFDYSMIRRRFQCVPSFDIDIAWAVKNRKLLRSLGALWKDEDKKKRMAILRGKEKDPYDTYDIIRDTASKFERIICFALLGDYSQFDKNIHWENFELGSLLRGLNALGGMGVHPSYRSYMNGPAVREEIDRLEQILGHEVTKSRQHFLRLRLPETYQILAQSGIARDYSMGFADNIGFRAGTAFPFKWFDVDKNQASQLLIFPFAYMDSAFKDYLKLSPEEAKTEIEELVANTKKVGGLFMFIWHNSSINDLDEWKGWKSVFDHTLEISLKE